MAVFIFNIQPKSKGGGRVFSRGAAQRRRRELTADALSLFFPLNSFTKVLEQYALLTGVQSSLALEDTLPVDLISPGRMEEKQSTFHPPKQGLPTRFWLAVTEQ